MIEIRKATDADWDALWPTFHTIVAAGDTLTYAPDTTKEAGQALWMSPSTQTYVAVDNGVILGSYWLKTNQLALGAHVANAGFIVSPESRGRGIGRLMGQHCLEKAKAAGFTAMQFNIVVSTNERAVTLWQSLGFTIVGTVPKAFQHARLGLVDIYVMHRFL